MASLIACDTGNDVKIATFNFSPTATIIAPTNGEKPQEEEVKVTFEAMIGDNYDAPPDLAISWSSDIDGSLTGAIPADSNGTLLYNNLKPKRLKSCDHPIGRDDEGEQTTALYSLKFFPYQPIQQLCSSSYRY